MSVRYKMQQQSPQRCPERQKGDKLIAMAKDWVPKAIFGKNLLPTTLGVGEWIV